MTKAEAISKLAKIFQDRLTAATSPWQQAGLAMSATKANSTTGSCKYQVDGSTVCVTGLTKAECDSLQGTWTEGGSCP
jgi:hypothetical protein